MPYALGAVKPHVKTCAETVGPKFGIKVIYGVGVRAGVSDHPKGLALDFMCDVATGRKVLAHLRANWDVYGIAYLIHEQTIYESATGAGKKMEDRGGVTANHFDHVHASFDTTAAGGTPTDSTDSLVSNAQGDDPGILDQLKAVWDIVTGIGKVIAFVTNPQNWWRMFLFLLGGALLLVLLWRLAGGSSAVKTATSIGKKVARNG